MRVSIIFAAAVVGCGLAARAATVSTRFNVRAYVPSICSLNPQQVLALRRLGGKLSGTPCLPSPTAASPPLPTITITREHATGLVNLTVSF